MKIYIMTDLEGVSGVLEFDDRKNENVWNTNIRLRNSRLLTGEVNAAVEGAYAAGATEVLVDDSHGGGRTIDIELLDKRVSVVHGRDRPRIMAGMDESFDGMLFVGAHAMAGTRGGVLYHTMSCDTRQIRLNSRAVGEIGIFAFVAGAFGVPMLLVSGDTAACAEAKKLIPDIVTAEVKKGLSRYAAISQAPAKARRLIREAARKAVRRRKAIAPLVFAPPFTYQADGFADDSADHASNPAHLPATWTPGDEIRAATARELISAVWNRDV